MGASATPASTGMCATSSAEPDPEPDPAARPGAEPRPAETGSGFAADLSPPIVLNITSARIAIGTIATIVMIA
jgi:hypothetical protein